jgi:hypothetical protein
MPIQAKSRQCEAAATKLLAAANTAQDPSGICVAYAELAVVSLFRGKFQQASLQSDQALKNYDKTNAGIYVHRLGWEPSFMAHCNRGLALLCLGKLEDAQIACDKSIEIAKTISVGPKTS